VKKSGTVKRWSDIWGLNWGVAPNPTRFLKKAGQKLSMKNKKSCFRTIFILKVLFKLFQKFAGCGTESHGFNY